jgi:hypothetical protein
MSGDVEKSPTVGHLASPCYQPSTKVRLRSSLHRLELAGLHDRKVADLDEREIGGLYGSLLAGAICCLTTSSTSIGACSLAPSAPR